MGRKSSLADRLRVRHVERGDTIVEVMISLIVIASILTGAFVVARTSSQNIRSSQEHAEALQLLQGQVELVRSVANTGVSGIDQNGPFCMNSDTGAVVAAADYAAQCTNINNLYNFSIIKATTSPDAQIRANAVASASAGTTYVFSVDWDALGGGTNRESFIYRLPVTP